MRAQHGQEGGHRKGPCKPTGPPCPDLPTFCPLLPLPSALQEAILSSLQGLGHGPDPESIPTQPQGEALPGRSASAAL